MALRKIPSTVGLNSKIYLVAKIQHNNLELILWDLGGKEGIRNIWNHYYPEAQIVLFLIDGVDRARFGEAKKVFNMISNEPALKSTPIVFLVNKHDQENCASLGFVREYFCNDETTSNDLIAIHISALTQ